VNGEEVWPSAISFNACGEKTPAVSQPRLSNKKNLQNHEFWDIFIEWKFNWKF